MTADNDLLGSPAIEADRTPRRKAATKKQRHSYADEARELRGRIDTAVRLLRKAQETLDNPLVAVALETLEGD